MLVTNDPWMTAGQINDLTVATPVFRGERMIGLFASTCHAPDIGGRLLSAEASDVYEEGLRLPIMKLARAGEMNEDLLALIRANVRTPRETVGDLYAQAAANDVGARSLLRCLDDLGPRGPRGGRRGDPPPLRDRDARGDRASSRDGRYEAVGYSDGHGERIELRLAAIIDGDEITLDFAGSSPQSEHGINVVLNYTHAYASFALKAAIAPGVPHNDGSFTPVHVTAPEGSILNCRPARAGRLPARRRPLRPRRGAGRARARARAPLGRQRRRALDQRLEPAQPDALPVRRRRRVARPRRPQRQRLPVRGRLRADRGARDRRAARPARALAADRLRRRGPWRGGLGQTSVMTLREGEEWRVSALADRTTVPAPGADGGHDGAPGEVSVDGGRCPPSASSRLAPDARVRLDLPGGGGVGDPRERDPQAVLKRRRRRLREHRGRAASSTA